MMLLCMLISMAMTPGAAKIWIYTCPDVPRVIKDIYKRSFSYMATNLWNQLPTDVKESATLDSFKQNYKYSKGWIK